ncbi:hypothetical protein [Pseudomonas phage GP100]|nr:hypothetical protein [Pseudomonas phage GP100]
MKVLFLESKAAGQCLRYAKAHGWDEARTQDLLDRCYNNTATCMEKRSAMNADDWWVSKCLLEDSHKTLTLNALFSWAGSPEGDEYWRRIFGFQGGR